MPFDRNKFASKVIAQLGARGVPGAQAKSLADTLASEAASIADLDLSKFMGSSGGGGGCGCSGGGRGGYEDSAFVPFGKLQPIDFVEVTVPAPTTSTDAVFVGVAGLKVTGAGRDSRGRRRDVRIFIVDQTGAGTVGRLLSMNADGLNNEPNVPKVGIPAPLLALDPQANWLMGARYLGPEISQKFTVTFSTVGGAVTVLWGMFTKSTEFLRNTQSSCELGDDD